MLVKASAVFREAKKYVAKDRESDGLRQICGAIGHAGRELGDTCGHAQARCRAVVQARLDAGNGIDDSVETWLSDRGYIQKVERGNLDSIRAIPREVADKIQAYRHAWLDYLAAEFEAQGD